MELELFVKMTLQPLLLPSLRVSECSAALSSALLMFFSWLLSCYFQHSTNFSISVYFDRKSTKSLFLGVGQQSPALPFSGGGGPATSAMLQGTVITGDPTG